MPEVELFAEPTSIDKIAASLRSHVGRILSSVQQQTRDSVDGGSKSVTLKHTFTPLHVAVLLRDTELVAELLHDGEFIDAVMVEETVIEHRNGEELDSRTCRETFTAISIARDITHDLRTVALLREINGIESKGDECI
jgi:hypothetical protein